MDQRQKDALDNYITGHYGEDQFGRNRFMDDTEEAGPMGGLEDELYEQEFLNPNPLDNYPPQDPPEWHDDSPEEMLDEDVGTVEDQLRTTEGRLSWIEDNLIPVAREWAKTADELTKRYGVMIGPGADLRRVLMEYEELLGGR